MMKDYNEHSNYMLNRRMSIVETSSNCFERLVDFDDNTNSKILFGNPMEVAAFRNRRRCNLLDSGTVSAWINDPKYVEDGSNGQVMVYQPKFYYKVQPLKITRNEETNAQGYILNKCIIGISDGPQPGYKLHPLFINEKGHIIDHVFIGAFEGSLFDVSEGEYLKYDGVPITNEGTTTYTGGADCSIGGDKLSSIAGVIPASGKYTTTGGTDNLGFTRVGAETTAKNRGPGWHSLNAQAAAANQLMMALEYSFNTQLNIGRGVVDQTDNSSYNCASYTGSSIYNSPISTATQTLTEKEDHPTHTGSAIITKSRMSGTSDYTETDENDQTTGGKLSVVYRGWENPYGNIWEFINGPNVYGNGNMLGGVMYICTDYNYVESRNSENYKSTGITIPNSDGWVKYFGYNPDNPEFDWMFIPAAVGAPSDGSGVIGDYLYKTANLNGYRIARLGGYWSIGGLAGAFFWDLTYGVGSRSRTVGSRVMYIPQT